MKKLYSIIAAGLLVCASIQPLYAKKITMDLLIRSNHKRYVYNASGLLKSVKNGSETMMRLTYRKNNASHIAKVIRTMDEEGYQDTVSFVYQKNDIIKAQSGNNANEIIYNKKHLMTLITGSNAARFTYNRKGQLLKAYSTNDDYLIYSYDNRGYPALAKSYSKTVLNNRINYTNYYNSKNLLIRTIAKGKYINATTNYQYKRIRIDARLKEEIIKQQKSLLSKDGYRLAYLNELPA